jgi:folate-binding Fe-S cluster repair protein YgfZ
MPLFLVYVGQEVPSRLGATDNARRQYWVVIANAALPAREAGTTEVSVPQPPAVVRLGASALRAQLSARRGSRLHSRLRQKVLEPAAS